MKLLITITDNHNGSLSLVGIDPQSQPRIRRTYVYESHKGEGRMVLSSFDTAPVELHDDLERMVAAFGTNPSEASESSEGSKPDADTWQGWTIDFDEPAHNIDSCPYDFQRACREIGAAQAIKPYGSREGDLPALMIGSEGPALDEVVELVNGKKRQEGETDEAYRARIAGGKDPYLGKPRKGISKEHGPDSPAPNPNPHTSLPGLSSGPVTDPEGMLDRMRAEPTSEELETAARDVAPALDTPDAFPPFPGDEPRVPFGTGTIQDALKSLESGPLAGARIEAPIESVTTVHEPKPDTKSDAAKPVKKSGKRSDH